MEKRIKEAVKRLINGESVRSLIEDISDNVNGDSLMEGMGNDGTVANIKKMIENPDLAARNFKGVKEASKGIDLKGDKKVESLVVLWDKNAGDGKDAMVAFLNSPALQRENIYLEWGGGNAQTYYDAEAWKISLEK